MGVESPHISLVNGLVKLFIFSVGSPQTSSVSDEGSGCWIIVLVPCLLVVSSAEMLQESSPSAAADPIRTISDEASPSAGDVCLSLPEHE